MSYLTRYRYPVGFPTSKCSTFKSTKKIVNYQYRTNCNKNTKFPLDLIDIIDIYQQPFISFESHKANMETIFKMLQNRIKIHALFPTGTQTKPQTMITNNTIKTDTKIKINLKSCYWNFAQIKLSVGFCTAYNYHYQRGQVWKLTFNDNLNNATKYYCAQIFNAPKDNLANIYNEYWDPVKLLQNDDIEWEKNGNYMLWYKNKILLGAIEHHYPTGQPLYYIITIQLYSKDITLYVEDEQFITYQNINRKQYKN